MAVYPRKPTASNVSSEMRGFITSHSDNNGDMHEIPSWDLGYIEQFEVPPSRSASG